MLLKQNPFFRPPLPRPGGQVTPPTATYPPTHPDSSDPLLTKNKKKRTNLYTTVAEEEDFSQKI